MQPSESWSSAHFFPPATTLVQQLSRHVSDAEVLEALLPPEEAEWIGQARSRPVQPGPSTPRAKGALDGGRNGGLYTMRAQGI